MDATDTTVGQSVAAIEADAAAKERSRIVAAVLQLETYTLESGVYVDMDDVLDAIQGTDALMGALY